MDSSTPQPGASQAPVCPICSTAETEFFAVGQDRLFRAVPDSFNLRRCRACRCIFQDPIPTQDEIRSFYPEDYWWTPAHRQSSAISRSLKYLETAYREFVALDHVRFLERCARRSGAGEKLLLDIGCGSGMFLHLARKRGFASHGMDVSEPAVQLAQRHYGLQVRQGTIGDEIWNAGQFDFITMFHVLEHLPDPRAALHYARRLLKPNGSLIVQVPNVESLQARLFGPSWYGLDVPRHLINFTPRAIDLLLRESGFEIRDRARFSLRDNPASIASSMTPGLDPVRRAARQPGGVALIRAILDFAYLGMVMLSLPMALAESALGRGGTIWVHARPTNT
jgi:SAM-dependent methyltransferase